MGFAEHPRRPWAVRMADCEMEEGQAGWELRRNSGRWTKLQGRTVCCSHARRKNFLAGGVVFVLFVRFAMDRFGDGDDDDGGDDDDHDDDAYYYHYYLNLCSDWALG